MSARARSPVLGLFHNAPEMVIPPPPQCVCCWGALALALLLRWVGAGEPSRPLTRVVTPASLCFSIAYACPVLVFSRSFYFLSTPSFCLFFVCLKPSLGPFPQCPRNGTPPPPSVCAVAGMGGGARCKPAPHSAGPRGRRGNVTGCVPDGDDADRVDGPKPCPLCPRSAHAVHPRRGSVSGGRAGVGAVLGTSAGQGAARVVGACRRGAVSLRRNTAWTVGQATLDGGVVRAALSWAQRCRPPRLMWRRSWACQCRAGTWHRAHRGPGGGTVLRGKGGGARGG